MTLFDGLLRFLGKTPKEDKFTVEESQHNDGGFYILDDTRKIYAGPYKRRADALGQLTRLRNSYTPAARRPNGSVR